MSKKGIRKRRARERKGRQEADERARMKGILSAWIDRSIDRLEEHKEEHKDVKERQDHQGSMQ